MRIARIGLVFACLVIVSIALTGRRLVYLDGFLRAVDWEACAAESPSPRDTGPEPNSRINDRYYGNGAIIPWVTYEAETMETNAVVSDPAESYRPYTAANESSCKRYVMLVDQGDYVKLTAQSPSNTILVKYSIPDSPDGSGLDATLSLYINGSHYADLKMTSRLSWFYGNFGEHVPNAFSNNPVHGKPRYRYDEVAIILPQDAAISEGDTIKLQKDEGDEADYYIIDLVDLEWIEAPKSMPEGFLSVTDFGAVPDDGKSDSLAFADAIAEAKRHGKAVWIPEGTFHLDAPQKLSDVTIQGAGMWYSRLFVDKTVQVLQPRGGQIILSDFAIVSDADVRVNSTSNGLTGYFGRGSRVSRLWIEHVQGGIWSGNMGLTEETVFQDLRIRNTMYDGINLFSGTMSSVIRNCTARNVGDDAFVVWSIGGTWLVSQDNLITDCTVEHSYLGSAFAVFGGTDNSIRNCVALDVSYRSALNISTNHSTKPFAGTVSIDSVTIARSGGINERSWPSVWFGAVRLWAVNSDVKNVRLTNITIVDSAADAIELISIDRKSIYGVIFDTVTIQNAGMRGIGSAIAVNGTGPGSVSFRNTEVLGEMTDLISNHSREFVIDMD